MCVCVCVCTRVCIVVVYFEEWTVYLRMANNITGVMYSLMRSLNVSIKLKSTFAISLE